MIIGFITGSGLEAFRFPESEAFALETDYGRVTLERCRRGAREIILLPRHGKTHNLPPHRINYRANLYALRQAGCRIIIALNAVGSLRPDILPGELVLPDQFIDCTKSRPLTLFDGPDSPVRHVDMSQPYCPHLRAQLFPLLSRHSLKTHPAGTYICTEGPRFETPAEIRAYASWGADVVGMTGVPEVVFARELGMCYAAICLVTNLAAGLSAKKLTAEEIETVAQDRRPFLDGALQEIAEVITDDPQCPCHDWWEAFSQTQS